MAPAGNPALIAVALVPGGDPLVLSLDDQGLKEAGVAVKVQAWGKKNTFDVDVAYHGSPPTRGHFIVRQGEDKLELCCFWAAAA